MIISLALTLLLQYVSRMPHQLFFCIEQSLTLFGGPSGCGLTSGGSSCQQILEKISHFFLFSLVLPRSFDLLL